MFRLDQSHELLFYKQVLQHINNVDNSRDLLFDDYIGEI